MQIYKRIAACLRDFAAFEREREPHRRRQNPLVKDKPCEGCGKPVRDGGLCPGCIELAAGACEWKGRTGQ